MFFVGESLDMISDFLSEQSRAADYDEIALSELHMMEPTNMRLEWLSSADGEPVPAVRLHIPVGSTTWH